MCEGERLCTDSWLTTINAYGCLSLLSAHPSTISSSNSNRAVSRQRAAFLHWRSSTNLVPKYLQVELCAVMVTGEGDW